MNSTNFAFRHARGHKLFTYFLSTIIFAVLILGLLESFKNGYDYFAVFFIIPAMFLIPIVIVYEAKARIKLSNDFIELNSFSEKKILFNDIRKIIVHKNSMILYGANCKVNISGEFEKKEEIFMFIADNIKDLPNIEIRGLKSEVNKYFQ